MKLKYTLITLSLLFTLAVACNNAEQKNDAETSGSTQTQTTDDTNKTKHAGELLISQADCSGCHQKDQKLIGPAYVEIAAKYKDDAAAVDNLAAKIILGGKGVWGEVPMTPHASLAESDAKEMVRYILSLK